MLFDALNLFSDAQAVASESENGVASSSVVNFGVARNIGVGENLYVVVSVDVALTDGSSNSAVQVDLQSSAYEAFNSVATTQVIGTFAALSAIGTKLIARIQPDKLNSQYGRLLYTSSNGNLTTGSFTAFVAHDIDAYTSYAAGTDIN